MLGVHRYKYPVMSSSALRNKSFNMYLHYHEVFVILIKILKTRKANSRSNSFSRAISDVTARGIINRYLGL